MKWLFLVAMIISGGVTHPLLADETHQGSNGSAASHAGSQTKGQSKLFEYVSACMAGRALGTSVGSLDLSPPGSGTQPPTGSTAGNGRAVFESRCLKCHNGSQSAPNFTLINSKIASDAIGAISSGKMPQGSTLSAQEKQDIVQYLSSVK